jgi:predicted SnoaL-like aldol condensation-catalyzing enzyme
MRTVKTSVGMLFGLLVAAAPALAQGQAQPAGQVMFPQAGCTATPAQLEANKKVAMEFFRPGITGPERVALADPTYKQHNPAFVKGAKEAGMNDYDYFKSRFGGPPAARQGGAGAGAAGGRGQAAGPQPPQGNPLEIVTAECDVVTVIHKNYRQDPTAAPGTFFEAYTFDTFRVRNGKLVEHWDSAVINPPAPGGGAGAPGAAPAGGAGRGNQ